MSSKVEKIRSDLPLGKIPKFRLPRGLWISLISLDDLISSVSGNFKISISARSADFTAEADEALAKAENLVKVSARITQNHALPVV